MDGVTRQKQIVEEPNKTRKDKASFVETPQESSTQIFKWFQARTNIAEAPGDFLP
jgi:hypothetical protein